MTLNQGQGQAYLYSTFPKAHAAQSALQTKMQLKK